MSDPARTVLLGVTGGIAAYKAADLASKLRQKGLNVIVVMTRSARRFIAPLTFEYLTDNPVVTGLWKRAGERDPDHIAISDAADVAVVAPATANIIGKLANGIADDALSTVLMAFRKTLIVAPAMNEKMYENPVVQENLKRLRDRAVRQIGPGKGWLACGAEGFGRMAEVPEILDAVLEALAGAGARLESGGPKRPHS
jgi:phosphopantothenoylcysteine decarboxylase/phosphopantothenate--cysteine ligase